MEVGVVGKPNVGKSTFFRAITLADAEIAGFPFTTIKPNIGVGYVRTDCACKTFKVECKPQNSYCVKCNRFVPVKIMDVAGLVPGAHEGKGLGNQFMDDLRQADALIHIIDISGRTNDVGEPTEGYDPEKDIAFLENEINLWFYGILKKNWSKISGKIKYAGKDLVKELADQLSGLQVNEGEVKFAISASGIEEKADWDDNDLKKFAVNLRESSKPIIKVANKIDLDTNNNYGRLKDKYDLIPVCAEAELALRRASKANLIDYMPGDSDFTISKSIDEKQKKALEFIRESILKTYGTTGIQKALNTAVFGVLNKIVVYPVENEHKLMSSKGHVLPDAHLLTKGKTALDLAFKIHTDIGNKFIGAIDCKTGKKISKDHVLQDGDVIKILTSR